MKDRRNKTKWLTSICRHCLNTMLIKKGSRPMRDRRKNIVTRELCPNCGTTMSINSSLNFYCYLCGSEYNLSLLNGDLLAVKKEKKAM